MWGPERPRDSAQQPGAAATAARAWATVRPRRPVSVRGPRGGRRARGCAGDGGGGRAVRGPRPGRRRPGLGRREHGPAPTLWVPGAEWASAAWGSRGSSCRAGRGDALLCKWRPGPRRPTPGPPRRACSRAGKGRRELGRPREPRRPGCRLREPVRNLSCLRQKRARGRRGGVFNCLHGTGGVGNFSIHGSERRLVLASRVLVKGNELVFWL